MGATCCSCGPHTTPTTNKKRKQPATLDETFDSQSDSDSEFSMATDNLLNAEESEAEMTPAAPHTMYQKEKAENGFKDAVQNGNDSLVMHFVQEYPELDLLQLTFTNGDNALQVAVNNKSYNLVLYLLNNGVSPNTQNKKNGETALHTAVRKRDVKVVAFLCKHRADVNITNNAYETPLTIAADNRDDDIIELLAPDTQIEIRERLVSYEPDEAAPNYNSLNTFRDPKFTRDAVADILSADSPDTNTKTAAKVPDKGNENAAALYTKSMGINEYVSFEQKLDASEKLKMESMRVARSNPFSKLRRNNTKKALSEMHELTTARGGLPELAAWLEKKQSSIPYQWQKRWVVVKGSHLLWSDKQRVIHNAKDRAERRKFNNHLNIMSITEITPVTKGKTQRKFTFTVGANKKKKFVWKCATKGDRDHWVKSLKAHIAHVSSILTYLGTK